MHFQDHDIVVEDRGLLFRACITAAALALLERGGQRDQPAEVLIADNRADLERIAVAAFRASGDANACPVIIGPEDVAVFPRTADCYAPAASAAPR